MIKKFSFILIFIAFTSFSQKVDTVYFGQEYITVEEFGKKFNGSYEVVTPMRGGLAITRDQALELNAKREENSDVEVQFGSVTIRLYAHSKL